MGIGWEAEWDILSNDYHESWIVEKDLAQTTRKTVREF